MAFKCKACGQVVKDLGKAKKVNTSAVAGAKAARNKKVGTTFIAGAKGTGSTGRSTSQSMVKSTGKPGMSYRAGAFAGRNSGKLAAGGGAAGVGGTGMAANSKRKRNGSK